MAKEKTTEKDHCSCCGDNFVFKHHHSHGSHNSAIYGLGVVGALFYFLNGASTLTAVLIGIFKALFWPAFVVFRILGLLQL